jgi:peptidoglycan/LPS O-acetylase OafA/YrhL
MIYFKNLDGLRFIAALFVIIGHCQHILHDSSYHVLGYSPWGEKLAGFGVDFFFVLSGFLISFLLIKELGETQSIKIRHFYIRRALRLWPLYFLVGILALVTAEPFLRYLGLVGRSPSGIEWLANFGYLFTFSINFQTLNGHMNEFSSPTLGHFWSLAVEEQFYLLWAPFLLLTRKKTFIAIISACLLGFYTTMFQPAIFDIWFEKNAWASPVFFTSNRFFHFGLGALLAYLVQRKLLVELPNVVSWVLQIAFFAPAMAYLFGHHFYSIPAERIIHGVISFGIILMAFTKYSLFSLENQWIKYFGKISFGIYIFHILAIRLSFKWLCDGGFNPHDWQFQALFVIISTAISVGIAAVSYEKIEQPFLALKKKLVKK